MTSSPIAAELRHVTRHFGRVPALSGVDLRIARGEVTALLGPNGAGKTTAVRLLLGLAAPDAGSVTVFGADPRRPAARARTGAMLQIGTVPETLRVREHLNVFRSYFRAPRPLAELLRMAGLEGLEDRMFGTLSGGERQRVLFALALCGNPELLLLDEPTVGLDVGARRALWASIRQLRDEGRAVLLTTHYLEEADALADRIVLMARGCIVAEGSPAEIKTRFAARRVRFVSRLRAEVVTRIAGADPVRREGEVTEVITSRAESVVRELLWHDPELSGLEVVTTPLEDAFLALTGEAGPGAPHAAAAREVA